MSTKTQNVYLYLPNLVGYARIILAGLACVYMKQSPYLTCSLYTISCLLDAVDGHLARLFNQCSKFGAVLDMVTDRSTTTCLLLFLTTKYPDYMLLFQFLIALDFSSHYMHMFSSLSNGSASHKKIDKNQNWLLRLYYHNQTVLFSLCAANELFWLLIYLISFNISPQISVWEMKFDFYQILAVLIFPFCALKHVMNLIQLILASHQLVWLDTKSQEQYLKNK